MLVSTTFDIPGCRITAHKGMVRGIIVRSPTIVQGILGGLKSIIGGRIGAYTEMCEQGRQHAYDQMVMHAGELGANAIVGVRYDASDRADLSPLVGLPRPGVILLLRSLRGDLARLS
ncbi:MAG: YbjQ family protein [Verrucomicrobia bacterium]|nr:YbjQ family protein [Verrucomicrobiota bacterium]